MSSTAGPAPRSAAASPWRGSRRDLSLVVRVGEVAHPMLEEHHIEWLAVCAEGKTLIRRLDPTGAPEATFCGGFAEHGEVYAYCNLHGLWKAEF